MENYLVGLYGYQMYTAYVSWLEYNHHIFLSMPAYQQLNNHKFVEQFISEPIDLTEDEPTLPESERQSPTQAKNFKLKCGGCMRSFTSKKRLENHASLCLGKNMIKPFACGKCTKAFKKSGGLQKHMKLAHAEKTEKNCQENSSGESQIKELGLTLPPVRSIFHSVNLLSRSAANSYP